MKKQPIIIATIFVAGLLFFSQTASAATLMDRQRQQTQRIKHGITSGQITPREAETLYQDQRQVRQLRRHFLADGSLSHREHSILAKRMDRSSDRIYRSNTTRAGSLRRCIVRVSCVILPGTKAASRHAAACHGSGMANPFFSVAEQPACGQE